MIREWLSEWRLVLPAPSPHGWYVCSLRTPWGELDVTFTRYGIDSRFPSSAEIAQAFERTSQRPAWADWQDVVDKSRADGDPEDLDEERMLQPDDLRDLRMVELPRAKA